MNQTKIFGVMLALFVIMALVAACGPSPAPATPPAAQKAPTSEPTMAKDEMTGEKNDEMVGKADTMADTTMNQSDTMTDTMMDKSDTMMDNSGTMTDTTMNQSDTMTDTMMDDSGTMTDTMMNQSATMTDTTMDKSDTMTDTMMNQSDTMTDTQHESGEMMGNDESGEMMNKDESMMAPAWFSTELTNVNTGETFKIADFKGKVVLVEDIAVWCSTCFKQQGEVKALHGLLGVRDDLVSVVLDVDPNEDEAILKAYTAKNGFDWIYAVAPPETAREIGQLYGGQFLNPPSAPMLIIDRQGEVHLLPFGVKDAQTLEKALEPFLNQG